MLNYLFHVIANVAFHLLCYVTNPIVVFFCDERGNLPKIFTLWQTYDNCLDVEWMITEKIVPSIFRYDFNKHYKYHLEQKNNGVVIPGYVDIIDPVFTRKEKIQRYFCRLFWLYRNCAYGFSYYVSGRQVAFDKLVVVWKRGTEKKGDAQYLGVVDDKYGTFSFFREYAWCPFCYCRVYLGWKFKFAEQSNTSDYRQLAYSISPFRRYR